MASLVPLAVFLGPMIVTFLWLPQRVDTAVRNAKPGSMVKVTALVDGDCSSPVRLNAGGPLESLAECLKKPDFLLSFSDAINDLRHPSPMKTHKIRTQN